VLVQVEVNVNSDLKTRGYKYLGLWIKCRVGGEMYRFIGSSSFVLFMKLNQLKDNLKTWNKEVFGDIGIQKSRALCEISWLELKEEGVV